MNVVPTGYPAPPLAQLLSQTLSVMQMMLIVLLFVNDKVMPEAMRENKMAAVFGIFLVCNMVSNGLSKTSAFEIYVGNKLVFSGLEAGRTPNREDIRRGFAAVGVGLDL